MHRYAPSPPHPLAHALGALALGALALAASGLLATLAHSAARATAPELLEGLAQTFELWLEAALLALPVGLALGLGCDRSAVPSPRRRALRSLVEQLVRTPPVLWGVLAAALVTDARGARVFAPLALALVASPRIALRTAMALDAVPAALRDAAVALGAGKRAVLAQIVWPAARKPILAGSLAAMARTGAEAAPLLALAVASPSLEALPLQAARVGPGTASPGAAASALALAALVVALHGAAYALHHPRAS